MLYQLAILSNCICWEQLNREQGIKIYLQIINNYLLFLRRGLVKRKFFSFLLVDWIWGALQERREEKPEECRATPQFKSASRRSAKLSPSKVRLRFAARHEKHSDRKVLC